MHKASGISGQQANFSVGLPQLAMAIAQLAHSIILLRCLEPEEAYSSPDRLGLLLGWFAVLCLFCGLTFYNPNRPAIIQHSG